MSAFVAAVLAAGMGIPDLGTASFAQGSATIARPADLAAFYYNPAGLASQDGLRLRLDVRMVNHATSFQRLSGEGSDLGFEPVSNDGGPSIVPMGGVSWRWNGPVPLTFALGGHPFNGYTGYRYPDPAELRPLVEGREAEVARLAPQRYTGIASDSKIYLPVAAVAARLTDWIDVGFAFQAPVAFFKSRQAIYANTLFPGEESGYDGIFTLDAEDLFTPTGLVGVSVLLPGGLVLGLAFQRATWFVASGKVTVELPPLAAALGAKVHGEKADVHINFPAVLRGGLRWVRSAFEVELAGVYERWSAQKRILLVPLDIEIELGGTRTPLPEIPIEKELRDAGSLRLGGLWRAGSVAPSLDWLTVRAGVLAETSAIRSWRQSLDAMHWERISLSGGLGATYGRYDVSLAYSRYIQPTRQIRNSKVLQIVAAKNITPAVVGNGDYDSQLDLLGMSLGVRFDP